MTDTELLQALVREQARTNELLEQIARQTAGMNPREGYSANLAQLIIGGPEELMRQNRERAARIRKQKRGGNP